MRRVFIFLLISMLVSMTSIAQKLVVESFRVEPNDLMASINRQLDANGVPCALVRVQLTRPEASFEGNIVGKTSYNRSEYLVYMSNGSKMLKVGLEGYKPVMIKFADYGIDRLESLHVYTLSFILQNTESFTESAPLLCPDANHPHMIDLGLPSGTKWACCNVGATSPEEEGNYFAWGEFQSKDIYNWNSYLYGNSDNCQDIGNDIAGTQYDVAHILWEGAWQMPNLEQIKELHDNCSRKWTTRNGMNGALVTGPNGKQIFLPAAGDYKTGKINYHGLIGDYWTSTLHSNKNSAIYLGNDANGWAFDYYGARCNGLSVRAVWVSRDHVDLCPDDKHPHMIDLGLPSGTKWACCNVGAVTPEEYGDYYAWGETRTKKVYDKNNYKYVNSDENYKSIGKDISGTQYDIAHVKWGKNWKMPSIIQANELLDRCKMTLITLENECGFLVTGPNGSSIFFPAAGMKTNVSAGVAVLGRYWLSSANPRIDIFSGSLSFNSDTWTIANFDRSGGQSVRAVCQ